MPDSNLLKNFNEKSRLPWGVSKEETLWDNICRSMTSIKCLKFVLTSFKSADKAIIMKQCNFSTMMKVFKIEKWKLLLTCHSLFEAGSSANKVVKGFQLYFWYQQCYWNFNITSWHKLLSKTVKNCCCTVLQLPDRGNLIVTGTKSLILDSPFTVCLLHIFITKTVVTINHCFIRCE